MGVHCLVAKKLWPVYHEQCVQCTGADEWALDLPREEHACEYLDSVTAVITLDLYLRSPVADVCARCLIEDYLSMLRLNSCFIPAHSERPDTKFLSAYTCFYISPYFLLLPYNRCQLFLYAHLLGYCILYSPLILPAATTCRAIWLTSRLSAFNLLMSDDQLQQTPRREGVSWIA